METVAFIVCLTFIIGITIYFYHEQTKRAERAIRSAFDRAAAFQNAALDQIRLLNRQESDE